MMRCVCLSARVWALAAAMACMAAGTPAGETPVGGANSPPPSPPPALVLQTGELVCGDFAVKVPVGQYTAPPGGAPAYSVAGPIAAFRGPDGLWRGHGYLETFPRLLRFSGTLEKTAARLEYHFENGRSYRVSLAAGRGAVLMEEESDLGPRNVYVFDCYYGHWLPSAGFAVDAAAQKHAFLYLPCYYDKPEVTINPAARGTSAPAGVAVLSAAFHKRDVAGFFARDMAGWKGGDTMGIQLWQRRQLPEDPSSRHFLGPETKSDSTPNPRTANLLGRSLYEGHVTIELNLGIGTRKVAFIVADRGAARDSIPAAFMKIAQENR